MAKLKLQDQLLLAARVASRAHGTDKRKDGTPYIAHPMRVMVRVRPFGIYCEIAALLHDVVEDTDVDLQDLRDMGFDPMVIEVVDRVTRHKGESYGEFILRCADHDLARHVKIADIEDNLEDQSALEPEEAEFLRNRYTKALEVLDS
jgi:(p)ppGpp synthase/HD superfamily hydrolase